MGESIADVVTIDENSDGQIDLAHLERELQRYKDRPLKIGSFSAASNVTGIGSKTGKIAILLHQYGALSFWDFAAAGPYVEIEMNMQQRGRMDIWHIKTPSLFLRINYRWTRYARDFGCQTTSVYQSCSSDAGRRDRFICQWKRTPLSRLSNSSRRRWNTRYRGRNTSGTHLSTQKRASVIKPFAMQKNRISNGLFRFGQTILTSKFWEIQTLGDYPSCRL